MEARLTKQLLMLVDADKNGHLTPAIQHKISNALDAVHKQIMREEQHQWVLLAS